MKVTIFSIMRPKLSSMKLQTGQQNAGMYKKSPDKKPPFSSPPQPGTCFSVDTQKPPAYSLFIQNIIYA